MEPSFFSTSAVQPMTYQALTNDLSLGTNKSQDALTDFFDPVPIEAQVLIGDNLPLRDIVSSMMTSHTWLNVCKRAILNKARSAGFRGEASYWDARSYFQMFFPQLYKIETISQVIGRVVSAIFSTRTCFQYQFYSPESSVAGKTSLLQKVDSNTGLFATPTPSLRTKQHIRDFFFHYLAVEIPEEAYKHFSLVLPPGGTGTGAPTFQTVGLFVAALSNEKELFMEIWNECWTKIKNVDDGSQVFPHLTDSDGNNLIHMAAYMGHTDLLKALCASDRNLVKECMKRRNNFDETPYDMALIEGRQAAAVYLEQQFPNPRFLPFSLIKYSLKLDFTYGFRKAFYIFSQELPEKTAAIQLLRFLVDHVATMPTNWEEDAPAKIPLNLQAPGIARCFVIQRGLRSLIRAGLNFKEAAQSGYSFIADLDLDSTNGFFNYFESVDLASQLLNEKRFVELKQMLKGESSSKAVIDTVIGFSLNGHENAFAFAGNGNIGKGKDSILLPTFLIKDFRFLYSDLEEEDDTRRRLIELWLPESDQLTALIDQAQSFNLKKAVAFLKNLQR